MEKFKYINLECDSIPKLRIDTTGRETEIWLDGKYMGDGITKVEFKAEGGEHTLLHIDMDLHAFKFEPEKDLVQAEQGQVDSPSIHRSIDESIMKLCKLIEENNFIPGECSEMVQALASLIFARACIR